VESAGVLATLKGHVGAITALSFAPNGRFLASSSRDGTVRLWNTTPGDIGSEMVAVLERHSGVVTCVAYNGEGTLIATAGHDKKVGGCVGGCVDGWEILSPYVLLCILHALRCLTAALSMESLNDSLCNTLRIKVLIWETEILT